MAKTAGEIIIGRPAEAASDFVADQRNEPRYNPRMIRADMISDGLAGKGTVFRSAAKSMGHTAGIRIELTGYDRPGRLASRTTTKQADMDGTLAFDPVPGGTRMRWSWTVRPKGAARVLAPVITRFAPVRGLLGPSWPSGHIGFPCQTTEVRQLAAWLTRLRT